MLHKFFLATLLLMATQISAGGEGEGNTGESGGQTGRVNCHADFAEFSRH